MNAANAATKADQKLLSVKIKLESCSSVSGGMYREGPPDLPSCGPIGGRFVILSGCKNKYDSRTCQQVQKMKSKTGIYVTKLSPGKYHFVWDLNSPALRQSEPCSAQPRESYDVEIQKPDQEVKLAISVQCFAP
ncbi:MAG: hypothetical protein J0L82_15355 [Deltaproteobacteria bacterium]|nr:hypothetical protein [Deltaproteobacteria bacterium]